MNKKILFFLLFSIIKLSAEYSDSLLTVLLMVKNEEAVIEKTLQPFIDAGIRYFVVLDTGSTDQTVTKAKELFTKYQLSNAYIIEQPFVDFSTSRNYLIEQAEALFCDAQFFTMLDAEWYINDVQGLLQFCNDHINSKEKAFYIRLQSDYNESKANKESFFLTRLFKAHQNVRFTYPVHEDILDKPKKKVPSCIYYLYNPSKVGLKKSSQRSQQDIDLLMQEYEKNPQSYRAAFFLGQTYANCQDTDKALFFYHKALEATENKPNPSLVHYRLGLIYEVLQDWPNALYHYMESFAALPVRAEPFIKIALHYWHEKKYKLCYYFALQATLIPMPNDIYIEQNLYDYDRYNILGAAALHVQEYEVGKQALQEALKKYPNSKQLLYNLSLYEKAQEQNKG